MVKVPVPKHKDVVAGCGVVLLISSLTSGGCAIKIALAPIPDDVSRMALLAASVSCLFLTAGAVLLLLASVIVLIRARSTKDDEPQNLDSN